MIEILISDGKPCIQNNADNASISISGQLLAAKFSTATLHIRQVISFVDVAKDHIGWIDNDGDYDCSGWLI